VDPQAKAIQLADPEWMAEELFSQIEENNPIVLKLLLIPVTPHMLARFSSLVSDYGLLHTAIQIGGKVIDWNAGSLVVPRQFSSSVYAAIQIQSAGTSRKLVKNERTVKMITDFIVKWNNTKTYSLLGCNCQDFVSSFLNALEIDLSWDPAVANYLEEIRKNPSTAKPHIRYQVNGKTVVKYFDSHDEFDAFTIEFRENDPLQYSKMEGLLKSFDRGFWFRAWGKDDYQKPKNCLWDMPTAYDVRLIEVEDV